MGFHFSIEHTNLVAFLTTPAAEPPRASRNQLYGLVAALAYPNAESFLVSRDPQWLDRVRLLGEEALRKIDQVREYAIVDPDQVEESLRKLRAEFGQYDLYALVVPPVANYDNYSRWRATGTARLVGDYLARTTEAALILFPEYDSAPDLAALDPLPACAALADRLGDGPGVVFWTPRGTAVFVPERHVEDLVPQLLMALRSGRPSDLDRLLESASERKQRRVLQLSDLHFGTNEAARNLPMLEAELFDVVREVDRVVITGDLFNNPEPQSAAAFRAFRLGLERICRGHPIVIPGNHDQRVLGNSLVSVGQTFEQISQIPWAPVVVDDDLGTVFLCLNSSITGNFARGRVTTEQLVATGAELRSALAKTPHVRDYLRVVLVHHHPFGFETRPSTFVQRLLSVVGLSDETFLLLGDAREFLDWCARWEVSIVLHGHKHVARYFSEVIHPEGARQHPVTAVGCGTSLGAEGLPLSYNIIHWDDQQRRWMARFFESVSGGPFVPKLITTTRTIETPAAGVGG